MEMPRSEHGCSQCGCDTIGQSYSHCIDHRKPRKPVLESYTVWVWEGNNDAWDCRTLRFSVTFKSLDHAKLFASSVANGDDVSCVEIENQDNEEISAKYFFK
jgi:hypothetical protein